MRIFLPDGDERATLATARSLVAAGHAVTVGVAGPLSLAGATRGVVAVRLAGHPLSDRVRFIDAIAEVMRERHIEVVLPVTDASVEAILASRSRLPDTARLPFPPAAIWRRGTDKDEGARLAREAGLDVPETVLLYGPDAEQELPSNDFFPAVLKPHRSVLTSGNGGPSAKGSVLRVVDRRTCIEALRRLPPAAHPVLLQREVVGPGEGLFLLRWGRRIVATFAHRRLREKPPWGGVSVYRESIAPPPALVEAGTALLARLDWEGVAMIECKRDLRTGRHVFMEINGRLWGSLQLALDAGVDFPALLMRCLAGEVVPPTGDYRVGVRSRWFWGDVDHLYLRLRHGPARLRAISGFFGHRPGRDREEIWRWRDPLPFVSETLRRLGAG